MPAPAELDTSLATAIAAPRPSASVSQPMRRSARPQNSLASASLLTIAVFRKPSPKLTEARKKSKAADTQHQVGPGSQPPIEQKTYQAADEHRGNQNERQLHGHGYLPLKASRWPLRRPR